MNDPLTIIAPPSVQVTLKAALAAQGVTVPTGAGVSIAVVDDRAAAPAGMNPRDVFVLPLRLGALIDRLRAGEDPAAGQEFTFGGLTLCWDDSVLVRAGGDAIALTEKERALLWALHRAGAAGMDRAALLGAVWGYGEGIETHTLETHIYRLRQKIERDPARPEFLVTDGNGYVLKN